MSEQKNWFFIFLVVLFRLSMGFCGILLLGVGFIMTLATLVVEITNTSIFIWVLFGISPIIGGGFLVYRSSFGPKGFFNPAFWQSLTSEPDRLIKLSNVNKNNKLKTKDKEALFHQVFYELLEINHGRVTALNLAMQSRKLGIRMNGKEANKFLSDISKEFNHKIELGSDGEIIYCFEYLSQTEIDKLQSSAK